MAQPATIFSGRRGGTNALSPPGLVVAIASALDVVAFLALHHQKFPEFVAAEIGVIDGTPHWRAFQNRLLGPGLVIAVASLGIRAETALRLCFAIAIVAQNFLLFAIVRRRTQGDAWRACRYVAYYSVGLLALQHYWAYSWDYIDAIVFALFTSGALNNWSSLRFTALFAVAIANRESALYIPVYLMLDASVARQAWIDGMSARRPGRTARFALGASLATVGATYVTWSRAAWFETSQLDWVGPDAGHAIFGNHWNLIANAQAMLQAPTDATEIAGRVFCGIVMILVLTSLRSSDDATQRLSLMLTIMLAGVFAFGSVTEGRCQLFMLPVALLLFLELSDTDQRPSRAQASAASRGQVSEFV